MSLCNIFFIPSIPGVLLKYYRFNNFISLVPSGSKESENLNSEYRRWNSGSTSDKRAYSLKTRRDSCGVMSSYERMLKGFWKVSGSGRWNDGDLGRIIPSSPRVEYSSSAPDRKDRFVSTGGWLYTPCSSKSNALTIVLKRTSSYSYTPSPQHR